MTDHDHRIAAVLEELRPKSAQVGNWQRVIADAGVRTVAQPTAVTGTRWWFARRFVGSRRLTIVVLLVCVGLAIPLIAVGTNGWWFQRPQPFARMDPKPISGVPGIIATGHWQGRKWTAVGYISKRVGFTRVNGKTVKPIGGTMVCMTTITGSLSNNHNGEGCGDLYGMEGVTGRMGAWTTYINSSSPSLVIGATAAKVARVVAVLNPNPYPNGKVRRIDVQLVSIKQVGDGIHFYVFTFPQAVGVDHLVLYDAAGHVLQRLQWG